MNRSVTYCVEQAGQRLEVSIRRLIDARLPLLRHLDKKRKGERRLKEGFTEPRKSLEGDVRRVGPRSAGGRCDGFDAECRPTSHCSNLCVRQTRERLDACHFPDDLAENDDLGRLSVVELVHNVLEDRSKVGTVTQEEHAGERSKTCEA